MGGEGRRNHWPDSTDEKQRDLIELVEVVDDVNLIIVLDLHIVVARDIQIRFNDRMERDQHAES